MPEHKTLNETVINVYFGLFNIETVYKGTYICCVGTYIIRVYNIYFTFFLLRNEKKTPVHDPPKDIYILRCIDTHLCTLCLCEQVYIRINYSMRVCVCVCCTIDRNWCNSVKREL